MGKLLLIAVRNLLAHQGRTLMLGAAVAVTSLVLTLLLGVTEGIQRTVKEATTTLYSGHLNVNGFYKLGLGSASPVLFKRAAALKDVRAIFPEARVVVDRFMAYGKVVAEKDSLELPMWGVDMAEEPDLADFLKPADAAEFGHSDLRALAKPGGIMLYVKQARKLKVKVGDMVTLALPTARNVSNTKDVKVVAVMKDLGVMSSFSLMLHKKDVQDIYQTSADSTGQILIYFKDEGGLAGRADRLRQGLAQRGWRLRAPDHRAVWMKFQDVQAEPWTGQKLDLSDWRDESSYMSWVLTILKAVFYGVTVILLFIIAMGVMNATWMSVTERTRELGTLRAIGMRRRPLMLMFLLEGLVLALAAGGAGMLSGLAGYGLLNAVGIPLNEAMQNILLSERLTLAPNWGALGLAYATVVALTTAGTLYPAYKASRLKPITAIQAAV